MLRSIQVVKDTFIANPLTNKELEIAMFTHLQRMNDDLELEGMEEGVDLIKTASEVERLLSESVDDEEIEKDDDDENEDEEELEDEDEEEDESEEDDDETEDEDDEFDSEEDEDDEDEVIKE